jgi:hypothetical protein
MWLHEGVPDWAEGYLTVTSTNQAYGYLCTAVLGNRTVTQPVGKLLAFNESWRFITVNWFTIATCLDYKAPNKDDPSPDPTIPTRYEPFWTSQPQCATASFCEADQFSTQPHIPSVPMSLLKSSQPPLSAAGTSGFPMSVWTFRFPMRATCPAHLILNFLNNNYKNCTCTHI